MLDTVRMIFSGLIRRVFAAIMVGFTPWYNKKLHSRKKQLFSNLEEHLISVKGDIVEMGAGIGANFQFFPANCSVIAVDPNPYMEPYLIDSAKSHGSIHLKKYIVCPGEDMREIEDNSVSVVVSTLVLCSVESCEKVFSEVIRILKPVSI